jgi:hypothetical protein
VVAVRLRRSATDRLLIALRSVLDITFGVAVLWVGGVGGVFLASPASATVAVPVQAMTYAATNGGKDTSRR